MWWLICHMIDECSTNGSEVGTMTIMGRSRVTDQGLGAIRTELPL